MKNLNQVLYNASLKLVDLPGQFPTEEPIFAFSTAQNIIRILAPFDTSWTHYAIFQASDRDNKTSQPSERLLMTYIGTQIIDQITYYVYESLIPPGVLSNSRADKILFTLSLYSGETATVGETTYTFKGLVYLDDITEDMTETLNNIIVGQEDYDFVRVVVGSTNYDYYYFEGTWIENNFLFEVDYVENRSEQISFALYKGDLSGVPTMAPDNTQLIIDALSGKVDTTSLEQNYFTKEESDGRYGGFVDDINVFTELPEDLSVFEGKYIMIRNQVTNEIDTTYYIAAATAFEVRFLPTTNLVVSEDEPSGQQIGDLWYDIE